ncbi:MAG: BMP family ABC transporter substrate-binding protein [Anaerolineaceae bacterium]|nr:BMP family ABC transporter substrate-binding protein [Anaerolineaceae bacterium]
MKRFYVLFTVLIVLALALGACTPAVPEAPMEEAAPVEEAAPAEEEPVVVEEPVVEEAPAEPMEMPMIVLVPAGRVGTEGFMFLSGQGYKQAVADFGFDESILESEVPEEWERNVRTAAQDGADLIIGVGSTMQDAVANVAPDFPDTKFALVDSYAGGDNVVGLISQEQEGTFLAGVLAASMTTSDLEGMNEDKVIGFIGGMDVPVIQRFLSGLQQGAAYVDPEVTIEVAYVGSFRDPAKAKELALAMIENQGVDIVYSVAGSFGDAGVFEAVAEKGVYGIGSDVDWDSQVPGNILTSVLKHTDKAVYDIIDRYLKGEFEAGEIAYGVADGVMDITDMSVMGDKIPDDVRALLDEIKAKIKSGEIVVERPES